MILYCLNMESCIVNCLMIDVISEEKGFKCWWLWV